ncbi:MAG: peptidoglycan DD-metalloendopeptidase family protein [Actinomycetota bacterium]
MEKIVRVAGLLGAIALALLIGSGLRSAMAQESVDDLRSQREESRRDAAVAAAELDALSAEDAELVEALAAIDAHIALQETRIAAVLAKIEAAEEQRAQAQADAEVLDGEIDMIRARLRDRAIEAYVSPRSEDFSELNTADLTEGALRRSFLDEIVGNERELVDQLRVRIAEQEAAERQASRLAADAEADRADLEARLEQLDRSRAEAEELRREVQVRVAEWQVISDEIADADRALEAEILLLEEEARRIAAEEEARRITAEEEAARLAEEEAARLAEEEEAARLAEEEAARAADDDAAEGDETDGEPPNDDASEDGNAEQADETDGGETEDGQASENTGDDDPPAGFAITHRPVDGVVTSPFGDRVHPIFGTVRAHKGIDLDGDMGDPIVAAADGIVLSAGWRSGYGNTVVLSHGGGYTTLYAHQTDVNVAAGATVAGGDLIGWVGSTGWSTGPHLHFEVRVDGVAIDPAQFF